MTKVRVRVQCLICGKPMFEERTVARVTHQYNPEMVTDLIRFVCRTPDCGNEVIVEGS